MRQRCLEVIGMAVVIMAVSGLLKLAPVTVAGQAPTATAQSGAEANTSPGATDLLGRTRPAGHLERRLPDPLATTCSVCEPRVFH